MTKTVFVETRRRDTMEVSEYKLKVITKNLALPQSDRNRFKAFSPYLSPEKADQN